MPSPFPPSGYVSVNPSTFVESLRLKVTLTKSLCHALEEWLCFDTLNSIQAIETSTAEYPPQEETDWVKRLADSQISVHQMEAQLDQLDEAVEKIRELGKNSEIPGLEGLQNIAILALRPGMVSQLAAAKHELEWLQKKVDARSSGHVGSPGIFNVDCLCAKCREVGTGWAEDAENGGGVQ
jgi:hypothetical protein